MVNKFFKKAAILFLWIAVWQLFSVIVARELLIPSPLNTLRALIKISSEKEFYIAVLSSILRILCGFILGVAVGFFCGMISVKSRFFKEITTPVLQLIKAVPVASFIILAFFWFQSTYLPVFIVFLMVLPIVWSSVATALENIDEKYIEMGKVFRLSKIKIFWKIKLPIIFPVFLSSSLTALGFAWKSGIAAEVISKPLNSLGGMLEQAKTHLEIAEVFALSLVVAMLSFLLEILLRNIFRRYCNDKN